MEKPLVKRAPGQRPHIQAGECSITRVHLVRQVGSLITYRITLSAMPLKFLNDWKPLKPDFAPSRLCEISGYCDIESAQVSILG